MLDEALHIDDEAVDPTFDLDLSLKCDHIVEQFCDDWVSHLDRDDRVCLGLFKQLNMRETKAADLAALMINRSDKTVHEWRAHFSENSGDIAESKQGKYHRSGILWTSEDLNKKATRLSGRMSLSMDS